MLVTTDEPGFEGAYFPAIVKERRLYGKYKVAFPHIKVAACPHGPAGSAHCACPCEVQRVREHLLYPAAVPPHDADDFLRSLAPGRHVQWFRQRGAGGACWWTMRVEAIVGAGRHTGRLLPSAKIVMTCASNFGAANRYVCVARAAGRELRPAYAFDEAEGVWREAADGLVDGAPAMADDGGDAAAAVRRSGWAAPRERQEEPPMLVGKATRNPKAPTGAAGQDNNVREEMGWMWKIYADHAGADHV